MGVIGFDLRWRRPFATGRPFGETGPYEHITGTVHFAVQPGDLHNAEIVDLDLAPRGRDGSVHFSADFALLQPEDTGRRDRLLFDVVNRGTSRALAVFNDGAGEPFSGEELDAGNGFLMRHGFTVAWCGWQQDLPRHGDERMGLQGPDLPDSVQGLVLSEFQPSAETSLMPLSDLGHRAYPPADPEDPTALLSVREYTEAVRRPIPRARWRFEDGGQVRLDGGFRPGLLYEAVYRATGAQVVGLGLLAVRDVVSWLRYGATPPRPSRASGDVPSPAGGGPALPNRYAYEAPGNVPSPAGEPPASPARYAYGFGRSQSGRFLRHFLYLGLNEDEAGRRVFDGVMPLVAGARRGEFNLRFGQPSKTLGQGAGALFPFSDGEQTDPVTGAQAGLLSRLEDRFRPKTMNINSSAEYWGGDRGSAGQASLTHTDPDGGDDVEPPEDSRVYLLAGTQHVGSGIPPEGRTATGIVGSHPFNCVNYNPYLRAALVALDRWARGEEPAPPNRFPRLAGDTAVPPAAAAAFFEALPGVSGPLHPPRLRRMDFGAGRLPPILGRPYLHHVSGVDADGNEVAGIRAPEIAVPLATYTGWNTREVSSGAPGELIPMTGATLAFPRTTAEAQARGDPRRPVATRYAGKDGYLQRAREAAEALVKDRYMLEEDVERVLARMGQLWDLFA